MTVDGIVTNHICHHEKEVAISNLDLDALLGHFTNLCYY